LLKAENLCDLLVGFDELWIDYSRNNFLRTVGKYYRRTCSVVGELESFQFLGRFDFEEFSAGSVLVMEAVDFLDTSLSKSACSPSGGMAFFRKLENVNGIFSLKRFQIDRALGDQYPTAFLGNEMRELFQRGHANLNLFHM